MLGFVARRLAAESVVLIFAARASADTSHLVGVPELTIGPLADPDARAVLESTISGKLDASVRDRIVDEARGNPLALLELARAWTPMALAGGFGLPDNASVSAKIEEVFRRDLSLLPAESRRLMLVAAAEPVGDRALILAAAERVGIPADAAEAATASGLIDLGTHVRFRHPLIRSVVYRDAPVSQRRVVHGALADATDATVDPDRRAWHLAAAASGPDEDIAAHLERSAARAQARGGLAAAAAFLDRAVGLTPDPARRAERALAAAQASFQAGAFDAAQRLLATAAAYPLAEFQATATQGSGWYIELTAIGGTSETPQGYFRITQSCYVYFVPDGAMEDALLAAVGRGVRVVVLVPGAIDHNLVRQASRGKFGKMLKAGVEIHEYRPALLHSKTMIVDGVWSTIGSTNLDNRSFALNDELNLVVYDPAVARRLEKIFTDDIALSKKVDYRTWRRRGLIDRTMELFSAPLRGLL